MAKRTTETIALSNAMYLRKAAELAGSTGQGAVASTRISPPEDNTRLLENLANKAMARRRELHERGELLTARQLCECLGFGEEDLQQAVREGRMFWIEGTHGSHWYPSFFVAGTASRCDVEEVTRVLDPLPGEIKWAFFTTPKYSLDGRTPIDALRDQEVARVLRTAAEFVVRNLGL